MRAPRLKKSLTVNATALMTATLATNALGLAFWAEAARLRAPAVVGRAAAAIAALTLLATISQLNLTNVFIRLLPVAGRLSRRLITRGYLAVIVFGAVIAVAYAATGVGVTVLSGGWTAKAAFVIAVDVLAVFALQDAVLTALRLTPYIPVENVSTALLRMALIPLLLVLSAANGIVLGWVIPAALAVIVVSALLFRRVLPRLAGAPGSLPSRRRLLSFVAGEYVGNLCATATAQVMPLLVIWQLGPTQAAYFTLPWLIFMGLTALMWNVSSSLVVEITGAHARTADLLHRSLLLWGGIVLGALVVCVFGAHPLLAFAGRGYAAHGSALLRLVGLSAPFYAVVALYSTLVWLDQRVWLLAGFLAISGATLLVSTLLLLPHLGLVAAGWANLGTQAVAAIVMAPLAVRRLRRGQLVGAS